MNDLMKPDPAGGMPVGTADSIPVDDRRGSLRQGVVRLSFEENEKTATIFGLEKMKSAITRVSISET